MLFLLLKYSATHILETVSILRLINLLFNKKKQLLWLLLKNTNQIVSNMIPYLYDRLICSSQGIGYISRIINKLQCFHYELLFQLILTPNNVLKCSLFGASKQTKTEK